MMGTKKEGVLEVMRRESDMGQKKKFAPNVALSRQKGISARHGPDLTKVEQKRVKPEKQKYEHKNDAEPARVTFAPTQSTLLSPGPSRTSGTRSSAAGGQVNSGTQTSSTAEPVVVKLPDDWGEAPIPEGEESGYKPVRVPFSADVATLELEQLSLREEEVKSMEPEDDDMTNLHQWFEAAKEHPWPKDGNWPQDLEPPPLLFLQLPTHLPTTKLKTPTATTDRVDVTAFDDDGRVETKTAKPLVGEAQQKHAASLAKLFQAQHSIKGVPEGQIGHLVFLKSGKVKLHLGSADATCCACSSPSASATPSPSLCLNLRPSTPCLFDQELISVSPETGGVCSLGPIRNRLVSSLDF